MELLEEINKIGPNIIALKEPTYLLMQKKDALRKIEQYSYNKKMPIFVDIDRYDKAKLRFFFENVDSKLYKMWRRKYHLERTLDYTHNHMKILMGGAHFFIEDEQPKKAIEEKVENGFVASACVPEAVKDLTNRISLKGKKTDFYILGDIIISNKDAKGKLFHVKKVIKNSRFNLATYILCSEVNNDFYSQTI